MSHATTGRGVLVSPMLLLAFSAAACGEGAAPAPSASVGEAPPVKSAVASAPIASAGAAPSASAPPSASAASGGAPPPADAPHCKAVGTGKLVGFGAPAGTFVGMIPRAGYLYFLAWKEGPAKVILSKVPRSGDKPIELSTQVSAGTPESFVLDDTGAYYSRKRSVFRMPLEAGEATELAKDFSGPIALGADGVYGVRCDPTAKVDQLVRVAREGGEAAVVASWERAKPGNACEYKAITLDGKEAFLADWNTRRVLAVGLEGGAVREIAKDQAFPGRILVEDDAVYFQASDGLHRAPRAGGASPAIASIGTNPFGFVTWDDSRFFVFQMVPYEKVHTSYSLPRAGGTPTQLDTFVADDVTVGPDVVGIAVDDECVYLARRKEEVSSIVAREKR